MRLPPNPHHIDCGSKSYLGVRLAFTCFSPIERSSCGRAVLPCQHLFAHNFICSLASCCMHRRSIGPAIGHLLTCFSSSTDWTWTSARRWYHAGVDQYGNEKVGVCSCSIRGTPYVAVRRSCKFGALHFPHWTRTHARAGDGCCAARWMLGLNSTCVPFLGHLRTTPCGGHTFHGTDHYTCFQ